MKLNRKYHRFIFISESLLARAALELKHWHVRDGSWWLGATKNSLVTRSNDVMDVITETFGFVDANTHRNEKYAYDKIAYRVKENEETVGP